MNPRLFHLRFVVDKVTLGQALGRVLLVRHVSVITPLLHTHFKLNMTLIRRTSGRRLATPIKSNTVSHIAGALLRCKGWDLHRHVFEEFILLVCAAKLLGV